MRKYDGIPELLDQFMAEQDADVRWVTVQELRDCFGLTRYQCNTVSGFLRRLEFGSFGRFPYRVLRIEQVAGCHPSDPQKCRYLVKRKAMVAAAVPGIHYHTGVQVRGKADSGGSG
ncbi:hypothetical protein [Methanoregula sp.]|uniref:hypothetical protein n=1 Tax=Methanoregula sp. TaxID=2052170 RepID=UPI00236E4E62|nr:hypothetical protein [Methanoregula sp.]MDD1686693.1 hypothetical protein [Methanoregula sp.]